MLAVDIFSAERYDRATTSMASFISPSQIPQPDFDSESCHQEKSPLSSLNSGILKTLVERRSTKGLLQASRQRQSSTAELTRSRWATTEAAGPEARQQARPDETTGAEPTGSEASHNCIPGSAPMGLTSLRRTHRERKERYIKALEDEVLRLKELFINVARDKERLVEENRQLRALLAQNGVGIEAATAPGCVLDDSVSNPSIGYTSSASMVGGFAPASSNISDFTTPPPLPAAAAGQRGDRASPNSTTSPCNQPQPQLPPYPRQEHPSIGAGSGCPPNRNPDLDYEQTGIDFVLTYETPSARS